MITATDIVWAIVVPAIVGIVAGIVCWRPWRRGAAKAWAGAAGMGGGFFVAFPAIQNSGRWSWPAILPHEGTDWLPWIAIGAAILAVVSMNIRTPRWVWAIVVVIVAGAGCGEVLSNLFAHTGTNLHNAIILLGFGIAGGIWWAILEALGEQEVTSACIVHWLVATCAAMILMLTGSQDYGLLTFPLAAVSGAICVISIWRRQKVRINGMPMVFSVMMMAILAGGVFLSDLKVSMLGLVLGAPVVAGFSLLLPQKMRMWQRMVVGILLAAIVLGVAVARAVVEFKRQESTLSDE